MMLQNTKLKWTNKYFKFPKKRKDNERVRKNKDIVLKINHLYNDATINSLIWYILKVYTYITHILYLYTLLIKWIKPFFYSPNNFHIYKKCYPYLFAIARGYNVLFMYAYPRRPSLSIFTRHSYAKENKYAHKT